MKHARCECGQPLDPDDGFCRVCMTSDRTRTESSPTDRSHMTDPRSESLVPLSKDERSAIAMEAVLVLISGIEASQAKTALRQVATTFQRFEVTVAALEAELAEALRADLEAWARRASAPSGKEGISELGTRQLKADLAALNRDYGLLLEVANRYEGERDKLRESHARAVKAVEALPGYSFAPAHDGQPAYMNEEVPADHAEYLERGPALEALSEVQS